MNSKRKKRPLLIPNRSKDDDLKMAEVSPGIWVMEDAYKGKYENKWTKARGLLHRLYIKWRAARP